MTKSLQEELEKKYDYVFGYPIGMIGRVDNELLYEIIDFALLHTWEKVRGEVSKEIRCDECGRIFSYIFKTECFRCDIPSCSGTFTVSNDRNKLLDELDQKFKQLTKKG